MRAHNIICHDWHRKHTHTQSPPTPPPTPAHHSYQLAHTGTRTTRVPNSVQSKYVRNCAKLKGQHFNTYITRTYTLIYRNKGWFYIVGMGMLYVKIMEWHIQQYLCMYVCTCTDWYLSNGDWICSKLLSLHKFSDVAYVKKWQKCLNTHECTAYIACHPLNAARTHTHTRGSHTSTARPTPWWQHAWAT